MKVKWNVLTDDDRKKDYIKWILESDLSLPKPPAPKTPEISVEEMMQNMQKLFNNNPWLTKAFQNAPSLTEVMSVQPMTSPISVPVIPMTILTKEMVEDRKKKELQIMSEGLQDGEILKEYEFGGWLSMRGGYFVVHKDEPNKILRYYQTRMS